MIEIVLTAGDQEALTAAEQYGLDILLDLSRLLRVERSMDCVQLELTREQPGADLASCLSANWHLEASAGAVRLPRSVLRVITTVVGAVDEQRSPKRDRYGRVPPEENALSRSGQSDEPVVSAAARRLTELVGGAAARRPVALVRPWPEGYRWAVALTHDLDVVDWWPGFAALRVIELLRKGEVALAGRVTLAALAASVSRPVEAAVRSILELESKRGLRSTWFILCGTPTLSTMAAGDLTYRPESAKTRRILHAVQGAGHEIGLHGSFATYDRPDVFRTQRARLQRGLERTPSGVRQHFLRMIPGATQRAMTAAGFTYDSSFGFADRNGFRLGVADVIPSWDAQEQKTLAIEEAPFSWMDRALSKYQRVEDPAKWIEDGLRIAARVREAQGLWVGIWHPNLDTPLGYPGALWGFEQLLDRLADLRPYFTTLGDAVRWRVARRSARAQGLRPDGTIEIASRDASESIELERPDGGTIPSHVVAA